VRFLLLLPLLAAQTFSGLQGEVVDSTGGALAQASVVAIQKETGQRRTATTNSAGQFTLLNLALGEWELKVEAPGFAAFELDEIQVSVGQMVSRRITLSPAGVVEKLEVSESVDGIDAVAPNSSVALGYERIEEAPARSRNYLNFVLAAPNVAPAAGSSSQRTMTGTRSVLPDTGFTFAGIRPRNNSIQIDGMDNRDETTGGNRVAVGLEMIQEFRVAAASVGAELGGAAGGILNVVTRSGVNLWHGDATWFMQQSGLNSRKPEIESTLDPEFTRYQPGVSGMGPLQRDRTFIAAAYEHERERAGELSNVPAGLGIPGVNRELYPTSTQGHELSSKLDHHTADRSALMMRYAFSRGRTRNEVQGPDNFADRSAQGSSLTVDHSLVASYLRVLSPSTVNELRAQFGQRRLELTPNGTGPQIDIPGVVTFGTYHRMDSARTERHYQIIDSFSFSRGGHRLNAGVDLHKVTLDAMQRDRFHGIFVYPDLAAFRAQRPNLSIRAFGDPQVQIDTLPVGAWLHDRWQMAPGLNLEAGVRFDCQSLPNTLPRSSRNFAPRAGLAWRPARSRALVFRAGTGLFFDRYPLAFLLPAVQNRYEIFNNSTTRTRYAASADFPSTYSRKLTAGFEYGFDKDTSLTLEASNIRGLHLPRTRNAVGTLPPQFLLEQTATSTYIGMTLTLNRRLSKEIAWLISWTAGRSRDDASDFDEQPFRPFDIRADWGPSRQDQRHRLAASAIFELPFLEGVSWAPIFTAGTGRPLNALLTSDAAGTGAYPLTARPENVGRNPFRSQKTVNLDLRVMKTFEVMDERALLQFGVESFNLLNHTNVERFSPYYANGAMRLPGYGGILESLPARQVQLMMQFEF